LIYGSVGLQTKSSVAVVLQANEIDAIEKRSETSITVSVITQVLVFVGAVMVISGEKSSTSITVIINTS
jgi:hypothetical protein